MSGNKKVFKASVYEISQNKFPVNNFARLILKWDGLDICVHKRRNEGLSRLFADSVYGLVNCIRSSGGQGRPK